VIHKVYEPQIRARLGTAAHFCEVVVLKQVKHLTLATNAITESGDGTNWTRSYNPGIFNSRVWTERQREREREGERGIEREREGERGRERRGHATNPKPNPQLCILSFHQVKHLTLATNAITESGCHALSNGLVLSLTHTRTHASSHSHTISVCLSVCLSLVSLSDTYALSHTQRISFSLSLSSAWFKPSPKTLLNPGWIMVEMALKP